MVVLEPGAGEPVVYSDGEAWYWTAWRWCAGSYDAAFVLVGDYVPPVYASIKNLETLCPGVWTQAWEAVGTP